MANENDTSQGGRGARTSENAMRLRQVQARYEKASRADDPNRAREMKHELAMEVLQAIAKGELRPPQRYAAAALGMEIPRPQPTAEQRERREQRRGQRGAQAETEISEDQRARRAERLARRERREAGGRES